MKTSKSAMLYCGLLTAALLATAAAAEPAVQTVADTTASNDGPVIVTARKRSEALQDVPLSISAVSAADLDRRDVQNVNDLYAQVPGLYTPPVRSAIPATCPT